jgi:hypothetical protein
MVRRLARSREVEVLGEGCASVFRGPRAPDLEALERVARERRVPCVLLEPVLDPCRVPEMLERFPDARVLFAVRHFEPVIGSALDRFGPEAWPRRVAEWSRGDFHGFPHPVPEASRGRLRELWRPDLDPASAAALYWLFYSGLHEDLGLAGEPRVQLLRHEELLADPQARLAALCRFLGVRYRPAMAEDLRPASRDGSSPTLDPPVRAACEALYARLCESARVDALRTAP